MRAADDGETASLAGVVAAGDDASASNAKRKAKAGGPCAVASQPRAGTKVGMKGRVEWKWGSMVCSGALIPARETATHCYARTHKGNIKTLAKGKPYWAVTA